MNSLYVNTFRDRYLEVGGGEKRSTNKSVYEIHNNSKRRNASFRKRVGQANFVLTKYVILFLTNISRKRIVSRSVNRKDGK